MPSVHKAVIILNMRSGLTKDRAMMSLYFDRGTDPSATDFDNLRDDIQAFFNTVPTSGTWKVTDWLAKTVQTGAAVHEMRFYKVPATRGDMGAPVAIRTWGFSAVSTGVPVPSEVAVCLSYQRAYGTDPEFSGGLRPRARDRGRIYIGPVGQNALTDVATTDESRFNTVMTDDLAAIAKQKLGAAALAHSWVWVHFSPTEWSWDAVTKCWVDNAFDIQRRRGVLPSYKATQTL